MKKLLSLVVSFFMVFTMAACGSQSHEEEIKQVVTNYFNIFKTGENLQEGDQYCTSTYNESEGFATLEDELTEIIEGEDLGDTFNEEARDFVKVCFENFIVSYDIQSVNESKDTAEVKVTINGVNYDTFSFEDYEDQINKTAEDYINAHMDDYTAIYQSQGEDAMYEKVYADSSKVVFGEMKSIVTNLSKETYDVIVQLKNVDGTWLIDAIVFA